MGYDETDAAYEYVYIAVNALRDTFDAIQTLKVKMILNRITYDEASTEIGSIYKKIGEVLIPLEERIAPQQ